MKWLAIVNPAAGKTSRDRFRFVAGELDRLVRAESVWTARPQHAREIAGNCHAYDGCIALGGDGTIAEVVNGMNLESQYLGIVPLGTGNGLARDLQLLDLRTAFRWLRRPRFTRLDLISVRYRLRDIWHGRYMASTSGLGDAAEIAALGAGSFKHFGQFRYAVAASIQRLSQKKMVARMRLDDGPWQEKVLTNLIVNNTCHAGPFCLFPEASLADGRFNLFYGRIHPVSQLMEDIGILTQTYFFERSLRCQAQKLEVELAQPSTLMIDGELVRSIEAVQYHVVPSRLLCCGRNLVHFDR